MTYFRRTRTGSQTTIRKPEMKSEERRPMRLKMHRIPAALLSLVLLLALAPAGRADETPGGVPGAGGSEDQIAEDETIKTASKPATGVNLEAGANTVVINLVPTDKAGSEYETDIVNAKVQADLYLVAPAVRDENGSDSYHYEFVNRAPFTLELVEDLKEAVAADSDPAKQNDRETMLKKFSPVAQAFTWQIVYNPELDTTKYPAATAAAGTSTTITVEGLDPGLYLILLRGEGLSKDETDSGYVTHVIKKGGGEYKEYGPEDKEIIVTRAFSDRNEFIFEPQLVTVPTKRYQEAQSYNTAYGEWTNILNITAKPDYKQRTGILKITKTLTGVTDLSKDGEYFEPATFSFSIVGKDASGETVYERDAAISITGPADEKEVITLRDIPVGTVVTVTESYSGAHYTLNTEPQTVTITAPTKTAGDDGSIAVIGQTVNFSNSNNEYHRGGHGIENRFEFDRETGTWQCKANGETPNQGEVGKQ